MKTKYPIVIYDGNCAFCERNSALLLKMMRGKVHRVSSRDPQMMELRPALTVEQTQARMYLLLPDGRLFGAAEAIARALALAPWGRFALVYYLPGVGALLEMLYRYISANRYRWWGEVGGCEGGACSIYRPPGEGNNA